MNSQFQHDRRSAFTVDLLGSAIALALVWGAFTMLFGATSKLSSAENVAPVEMSVSFDIYDSVMYNNEDWQMLASR